MCSGIESGIIEMGRQRGECESLVQAQLPAGSNKSDGTGKESLALGAAKLNGN